MLKLGKLRAGHCIRAVPMLILALAVSARASDADAVLYRIFLRDGLTVVSYGEFARVANRVVFSIPIGTDAAAPSLQLVSIPEATVDWEKTDRYAEAARARRYAETRGEADFTLLSSEVARVLNEVALTDDPTRRVALADYARKQLAQWPLVNYGYRSSDVAQLSALLDELVSDLRVAAGHSRFDLSLVANTVPPAYVPLLPGPGLRESIEQAFIVAGVTPEPAERASLFQAILKTLEPQPNDLAWVPAIRARAVAELSAEQRTDERYKELSSRSLEAAAKRVKKADIRAIEALIRDVLKTDASLGHRRPHETAALLAVLDGRLNEARRLRLASDAWNLRVPVLRTYRRDSGRAIGQLRRSKKWLEEIRQLAGPSPQSLDRLAERLDRGRRELHGLTPPAEFQAAHEMLDAAYQMAARAGALRRAAVSANDMNLAWQASSAAAGALMLLDRARVDLDRLTAPPRIP
ncbi:MAG: hypothetical protein LC753_02650 [Acidobacteria bacterium]|nr:hypothetical protein [Acidobacteriota bacterium]